MSATLSRFRPSKPHSDDSIDNDEISSAHIEEAKKTLQLDFQSPQPHQYPKTCASNTPSPNSFQTFAW